MLGFVPDNHRNEAMTAQGDFIQSSIFETQSSDEQHKFSTKKQEKTGLVWVRLIPEYSKAQQDDKFVNLVVVGPPGEADFPWSEKLR